MIRNTTYTIASKKYAFIRGFAQHLPFYLVKIIFWELQMHWYLSAFGSDFKVSYTTTTLERRGLSFAILFYHVKDSTTPINSHTDCHRFMKNKLGVRNCRLSTRLQLITQHITDITSYIPWYRNYPMENICFQWDSMQFRILLNHWNNSPAKFSHWNIAAIILTQIHWYPGYLIVIGLKKNLALS